MIFKKMIFFLFKRSLEILCISIIVFFVYFIESKDHPFMKNIEYIMIDENQKLDKERIINFYKEHGIGNVIIEVKKEKIKISYNSFKTILPSAEFLGKVSEVRIYPSINFKTDTIKMLYLSSLAFLIFSLIIIKKENIRINNKINTKNIKIIVLAISVLFVFTVSYEFLIKITFNKKLEPYSSLLIKLLGENIFLQLFVTLISPISEELYFRAYVFNKAKKYFPNTLFPFLSASLFFAMCHFSLSFFIYYFLIGYLLCFIYEKSGSILLVIFLHILNNFIYWIKAF